jgi:hypothetical protein
VFTGTGSDNEDAHGRSVAGNLRAYT